MDSNDSLIDIRFSGVARLYGAKGLERLQRSHIAVVGLGGVGSWAVESLVRSGVGSCTLIDLDEICVTNINRQIHALSNTVGHSKAKLLQQRAQLINPECRVDIIEDFLTEDNCDHLLGRGFDYVLDAIDGVAVKCHLIDFCKRKAIPIITVGGAGGRRDPAQIKVCDLSKTYNDFLLQRVRKKLRRDYGFTRNGGVNFKIKAVFSPELPVYPNSEGGIERDKKKAGSHRLDCATGLGTASFITGSFGLFAAAYIVNELAALDAD